MSGISKAQWLREHGWRELSNGKWRLPRSTMPPLDTDAAYVMGKFIEEEDAA